MNIQDNEVIILNGVEYIRKETVNALPSEPKFEIGKWYHYTTNDPVESTETYRVCAIQADKVFMNDSPSSWFNDTSPFARGSRPATPQRLNLISARYAMRST